MFCAAFDTPPSVWSPKLCLVKWSSVPQIACPNMCIVLVYFSGVIMCKVGALPSTASGVAGTPPPMQGGGGSGKLPPKRASPQLSSECLLDTFGQSVGTQSHLVGGCISALSSWRGAALWQESSFFYESLKVHIFFCFAGKRGERQGSVVYF